MTRVLVVSASADLRGALCRHLESASAHAWESSDGIDAIGRAEELGPDAVVVDSDVGPPGASVVCRILQKRLPAATFHVLCDGTVPEGEGGRISRDGGPLAIAEAVLGRTVPAPTLGAPRDPPPAKTPGRVPFERIDHLVEEGRWAELRDALRAPDGLAADHTPRLGLLYAVACKEATPGHVADADAQAIRAVQMLLDLPQGSATALVLAKRLLRRNPVAWGKREPSARMSITLVALVLLVAGLVGWLLTRWLL